MSGSPLSVLLVLATFSLMPEAQGAERQKINTQKTRITFEVAVDQRQYRHKQLRFPAPGTIRRSDFDFVSAQSLIADEVRIILTTDAEVG